MKKTATLAIVAGALLSVSFTLYAGRRNPSILLMSLFAIWVLAPFAGMLLTHRLSGLNLTIATVSTAFYGYIALGPARPRTASTFLIVPLASWLLIVAIAVLKKRSAGTRANP